MKSDHMPKIPEHAKMRVFHGGYPDEPNAPDIRKCERCGRLTAPDRKPCAYCGAAAQSAAEREGEERELDARAREIAAMYSDRASLDDVAAREAADDDAVIGLLLLRQASLTRISADHPDASRIAAARDSAISELKWRMALHQAYPEAQLDSYRAALLAARRGEETLARVHARLKAASDLFATLRMEPHFSTAEFDKLVALAATPEPR